jgi:hypothetical protein
MKPASEIIARCGGPKAIADWLGLERTAVQRWTYEPPKGTGEQIPVKHWAQLIGAAKGAGITILVSELLPADVANIAALEPQQDAA